MQKMTTEMHVHLQMLKFIILYLVHSRNYTSCVENVEYLGLSIDCDTISTSGTVCIYAI